MTGLGRQDVSVLPAGGGDGRATDVALGSDCAAWVMRLATAAGWET